MVYAVLTCHFGLRQGHSPKGLGLGLHLADDGGSRLGFISPYVHGSILLPIADPSTFRCQTSNIRDNESPLDCLNSVLYY